MIASLLPAPRVLIEYQERQENSQRGCCTPKYRLIQTEDGHLALRKLKWFQSSRNPLNINFTSLQNIWVASDFSSYTGREWEKIHNALVDIEERTPLRGAETEYSCYMEIKEGAKTIHHMLLRFSDYPPFSEERQRVISQLLKVPGDYDGYNARLTKAAYDYYTDLFDNTYPRCREIFSELREDWLGTGNITTLEEAFFQLKTPQNTLRSFKEQMDRIEKTLAPKISAYMNDKISCVIMQRYNDQVALYLNETGYWRNESTEETLSAALENLRQKPWKELTSFYKELHELERAILRRKITAELQNPPPPPIPSEVTQIPGQIA